MVSFGGNSRRSLLALRAQLDSSLNGLSADKSASLSEDLILVLRSLDSTISLRRAFTDPARDSNSKESLARDLYSNKIDGTTLKLVEVAAASRWSTPSEFADAIEQLAVEAQASAANMENQIDVVQTELFKFAQIINENYELRLALSDSRASQDNRVAIVQDLFGSMFNNNTLKLIAIAVQSRGHRTIEKGIEAVVYGVSARRNRVNALVKSNVQLTAGQSEKLENILSKKIGQPVHLNFEIDSSVIGGVSVEFQDEIIDGTIRSRLVEAGRLISN